MQFLKRWKKNRMATVKIPLPPDPAEFQGSPTITALPSIQTATIHYNPQNMTPGGFYNITDASNVGFQHNMVSNRGIISNSGMTTFDDKPEDLIICQEDLIADLNDLLADMEDEGGNITPMNIWACSLYNILERNLK